MRCFDENYFWLHWLHLKFFKFKHVLLCAPRLTIQNVQQMKPALNIAISAARAAGQVLLRNMARSHELKIQQKPKESLEA